MSVHTSETWSTVSDMRRSWAISHCRLCIAVNTTHSQQLQHNSRKSQQQ